ncbi:nucleotide pyrophosphohydrolase [Candidatus Woesearchaeota archaeon CG_4_10_14_0_2_um_filter_33_13]|nr:MAG: nucleotide pyrophosphohydrolase [Candidatus Woesearchaeota archaeon CG_4_10_14_0_2_um_filter_33_13]
MSSLEELREKVKQFNLDRDWDQFHNPKDLIIALLSEVGELAECYRWLSSEEVFKIHLDPLKKQKVSEEVADILMYLLTFSYKIDIDLLKAVEEKLEKNKLKYPVEKSKGIHSNPLMGFKGVLKNSKEDFE